MFKNTLFSIFLLSCFLTSFAFAQTYVTSMSSSYIVESNQGVVVGKRMVRFESEDSNAEGAGTAVGAVSGGLIGSTIGKGTGHIAGAVGGAVLGGIFGNTVGKSIKRKSDYYLYDYTIRLNSGTLINVWQSPDVNLPLGQQILFERSSDGRTFLLPNYY